MRIFGWEFLVECHQPDKSCDHKHCNSRDKMFLICHMASPKHIILKGFVNLWVEVPHDESPPSHVLRPLV